MPSNAQVVSKYLWSHTTPWLQKNIHDATHGGDLQKFSDSPFVGIHVRRGDKIKEGEADLIGAEVIRLIESSLVLDRHTKVADISPLQTHVSLFLSGLLRGCGGVYCEGTC